MRALLLSWLLLVFLEVWSGSQNHREALLEVQIPEPSLDPFNLDLWDRAPEIYECNQSPGGFYVVSGLRSMAVEITGIL